MIWGHSVRLEWFRSKFSDVTDADLPHRVMCYARVYLLYLVRCTIFAVKSRIRVSILYLSLFEDPGMFLSYAWGAVAPAYLYSQLGYVSRTSVKWNAGFLLLLDVY